MPDVFVAHKGTLQLLEACILWYRRKHAAEAREIETACHEFFSSLRNTSGMDYKKQTMVVGHIPIKLYAKVNAVLPDFWNDEKNRRLFYQTYKRVSAKGA